MSTYRRSRHLVMFWQDGRLVCQNYRSKPTLRVTPDVLSLLDSLSVPQTLDALTTAHPDLAFTLADLLEVLILAGLVERDAGDPAVSGEVWAPWEPLAAAYHFSTRNGTYPGDPAWVDPYDGTHSHAPEQKFTHYPDAPRLPLSDEIDLGTLTASLEQRRTCRAFGPGSLTLEQLSTLLGLTFGVRGWRPGAEGKIAYRTSPSGGARHPIEAYICAQRIDGIVPGLYHYDSVGHELARLRDGVTAADVSRYLVRQAHFLDAAVLVFLVASVGRTIWRYASPRAYRTLLIEAGHLGQSFALVATALGLGPFSTLAFAESDIETDLGLDGVNDSVIYVVGAGPR